MAIQETIERTRRWIAEFVIGLNLCPFARRVFEAELIRFVVSEATSVREVSNALVEELHRLANTPRGDIETTLVIFPCVFKDFLDFNDFLHEANELVRLLNYEGTIQIASFHPTYRFAGTADDDAANYTNRSPFPMLHLLREASITEVADRDELVESIPERNIELLRSMGRGEIEARLRRLALSDDR